MSENQSSSKTPQYIIEVDIPLKLHFQQDGFLVIECYQSVYGRVEALPLHLKFSPSAFAGIAKAIKEKLDAGEIILEESPNKSLKQ